MNIPQKIGPDSIEALLSGLLKPLARIEFIPNPGNAGDGLINAAAFQLFRRCALKISTDSLDEPDAFIYPGGGNLIPQYEDARNAILSRIETRRFGAFVILPHTIRGNEDLLARMDQRFHVFCRDLETHVHVTRCAPQANAYLTDDLALTLNPATLNAPLNRLRCLLSVAMAKPKRLARYYRWRQKIQNIVPHAGRLSILRVDDESADRGAVPADQDLSACYLSDFRVPGEAELIAGDFLRVLDAAQAIETDRLHVGIGGSLLGKQVLLRDNSYGKNKAVYELSLRGRFPGTTLLQAGTA